MNIQELAQILDFDEEDAQMLLEVFVESAEQNLQELFAAIKKQDYETMHKAAHAIKGSASNLLLDEIVDDALFIEQNAKQQHEIVYEEYAKKIKESIDTLK